MRRSWGSAVNLLSSLGLATTAIGAGVISSWINTNDITAIDPILKICYLELLEGLGVSRVMRNVEHLQSRMFKNLREEVKKNKRLQTALLLFVLYLMRRLPSKVGLPSPNNRRQIGRR